MSEDVKKLYRTAIKSETEMRLTREREENKLCKNETYSSINHLLVSFEKILEQLPVDTIEANKSEVDNVYYHIGKIKGCG